MIRIGGMTGYVVESSAPEDLDMVRDEVRIASNEGLGHFEPNDCGEPIDGAMEIVAYGRRFRLRCEEV